MKDVKIKIIFEQLNSFIKKYYYNQLIKGSIYVVAILLIFFILLTSIEYFFAFGVLGRTILFWTYIVINIIVFIKLIVIPILNIFKIGNRINYNEAAKIVGDHFTEIDDKLLNLLELSEISDEENHLILASINQKIKKISPITFKNAIDFTLNKKYLKWAFIPIFILILFFISGKEYVITESSARIIKHNSFFEPLAPFEYIVLNENLNCNQFDDFSLTIFIEGEQIPSEISIFFNNNKYKMKALGKNKFHFLFKRVASNINFNFNGGGYISKPYIIECLLQPKVINMEISVSHPPYTNKGNEFIMNNGDIIVSEGSSIKWNIELQNSNNCLFVINDNIKHEFKEESQLSLKKRIYNSSKYSVITSNINSLCDTLEYSILVVKDEFPKINVKQSLDSVNNILSFNGIIQDDYLVNNLQFHYYLSIDDSIIQFVDTVKINKSNYEQFFYAINLEKLNIKPGQELNYFFKVWDNDAVNKPKFTKSQTFSYQESSADELINKKNQENQKIRRQINQSMKLAEDIQKEIKDLNKNILEKDKIGWEEKEKAKKILQKQKDLEQKIKQTNERNSKSLKINEKLNASLIEKQKKLEELMNKVFTDEMKKLLEEMEQQIQESDKEKLKTLLEKLQDENSDLEKELDRELELFKQLEFEQQVQEAIDKIKEIKKAQENLRDETLNTKSDLTREDLVQKQDSISKKMDSLKKELEEIKKANMELEKKNAIPKTEKLETEISEQMLGSKKLLEKGLKRKSNKSQEKAIESIKKLENELEKMQTESNESRPIEDMQTLRKILDNLIVLSLSQEELMSEVRSTYKGSSKFVQIIRKQARLRENSEIIQDSLYALSKRVLQIQATINKEISSINSNIEKTIKTLELRDINNATKRQQFVMTSTNNLALLLSEILEQMQKELDSPPSQCNKPKNCNKPNPNCSKPSMSELKKAQKKLNEKINKAKKGKKGKKGKGEKKGENRSKELMELAKNQEQIRKQLMELRDEMGKNGEKGKIDNIINKMEENETDIINNRIIQETINRQEEILSKLLEADDARREQDKDQKRESTEWEFQIDYKNSDFIDYQKQKNSQNEMLKTVPLQLNPFYKKKVKKYFQNMTND